MYQQPTPSTGRYDDPPAYEDVMRYPHEVQKVPKTVLSNYDAIEILGPNRPLPPIPNKPTACEIASKRIIPTSKKSTTTAAQTKPNVRTRRYVPSYRRKPGLWTKICFMLAVTLILGGVVFGIYCFAHKKFIFAE